MVSKLAVSVALLSSCVPSWAFSLVSRGRALLPQRRTVRAGSPRSILNMKVGIVYSTQNGNTEACAEYISSASGADAADVDSWSDEDLAQLSGIIVGAPTWNTGADDYRSGTGIDDFLYDRLPKLDMSGKSVAVFGLGDQESYGDYYCDAMEEVWTCLKGKGAKMLGAWSTDGYEFSESKSVKDGKFVGLALDEDNQSDLSEGRCKKWVEQLKSEGMPF